MVNWLEMYPEVLSKKSFRPILVLSKNFRCLPVITMSSPFLVVEQLSSLPNPGRLSLAASKHNDFCFPPSSLAYKITRSANFRTFRICRFRRIVSEAAAEADLPELDVEEGWTPEQLDVLASLFRGMPKRSKDREPRLPLPMPYKLRPLGFPKSRRVLEKPPALARSSIAALVLRDAKDKRFLAKLAADVDRLPKDQNVSTLLERCAGALLRGSLSATIRELGRLGNAERALHVFLWQGQYSHLWPDDRTLCATLEVLAEAGEEKKAWDLQSSWGPSSSLAFEALAHGFIKSQKLDHALRVKEAAEGAGCVLDQSVFAELILLASRLSRRKTVLTLVQQLGRLPELRLKLEDCTAVMVSCSKAGVYEAVENLFGWWKSAGFQPNVVMYTILMTSLSKAGKNREALAVYWDMERIGCAPDLPAFRVLIRLCVEMEDALKALRLFARMKEAGISPTRDVYINLIKVCCKDGRLGKAKELLEAMRIGGIVNNAVIEDFVEG